MVEVKVDAKAIVAKLKKLATKSQQSRALMATIGAYMVRETFRTFDTEGKRIGKPWAPFADSTLHPTWTLKDGTRKSNPKKWNHRYGTDGSRTRRYSSVSKLLLASGGLRNSIQVRQLSNRSVTVATRYPEKMVQGIVDRRRIFAFTLGDRQVIRQLTVGFIKAAFSKTPGSMTVAPQ